ncbi:hypothetical protein MKW92_023291 [Papaver armeniacum]|nr:hypothetical protein MKW92_023291 [Papaver armeniacum]
MVHTAHLSNLPLFRSFLKIGNLYFSFTNPSLSMLLTLGLVLLLVHFVTKNGGGNLVPNTGNPWSSKSMTSFTVTSHFLVTLGLSFSIFIGITIVGFRRRRASFLKLLATAGVPLALAPFLVLLELISYCFRALSLGIRLFANMIAGHSLVKILSGHLLMSIRILTFLLNPEADEEDVPRRDAPSIYLLA